MTEANFQILEKHKIHWHTLRDAHFITNLQASIVTDLEKVYQEEINKDFHVNKWCNSCVSEMVRILYMATKFDTIEAQVINNKTKLIETDNGLIVDGNGEVIKLTKKRGRKRKNANG